MATPSKKLQRMREQLLLEEDKRAGGAQREEAGGQDISWGEALYYSIARQRQQAQLQQENRMAGPTGREAAAGQALGQAQALGQVGAPPDKAARMRQWEMLQQDRMAGGASQPPDKAARMRQWEMLQQDRMAGPHPGWAPALAPQGNGGSTGGAFSAPSGGTAPLAYAPQNQLIQAMPPLTPAQQYAEKVVRYGLEGAAAGGGRNSFSFAGDRRNAQVDPQKSAKQAAYFNNGADGVSLPHTLPLGSYIASAGASDRGMPLPPEQRNSLAKWAASNPMYANPAQNTSFVKNGSNDDKEVSIGEILPKPGQENRKTATVTPPLTNTPTPVTIEAPETSEFYDRMERDPKYFASYHGSNNIVDIQTLKDYIFGLSIYDTEGRLHYGTEYTYPGTNIHTSAKYNYNNGWLYLDCHGLVNMGIKAAVDEMTYKNLKGRGRIWQFVSGMFDNTPKEEKGLITDGNKFLAEDHPEGTVIFVDATPPTKENPNKEYDHVYFYFKEIALRVPSPDNPNETITIVRKNVLIGIGSSEKRYKLQVFDAAEYFKESMEKSKKDRKYMKPSWGYVAPMK